MSLPYRATPRFFDTPKGCLNPADEALLIQCYTQKEISAHYSGLPECVKDILKNCEFTQQQAGRMVAVVRAYYKEAAATFTDLQKLHQFRLLRDGFATTVNGSWAHSVFIDLAEDWVDRSELNVARVAASL